jgi:hypothetical protein
VKYRRKESPQSSVPIADQVSEYLAKHEEDEMQKSDWYLSSASGTKDPAGNMTWAEADRSWMKAKGRSVRTVLDSVDLMKTREKSQRRRKVFAAAFFAAAGLGLAALMAFAVGGSQGDGQALANIDDSQEDAQDTGADAGISFAAAGQAATEGSQPAGLKASVTGNGGPGGASLTGGVDIVNPTNPTGTLPPPIDTGGGGNGGGGGGNDGGGDDNGGGGSGGGGGNGGGGGDSDGSGSPVDVGATLGDPLGGGSLLDVGGVAEGLLSINGEVSGQDAGSLIPAGTLPDTGGLLPDTSDGNLLDIDISGDPENTDDPAAANVDVNAGETDANVNDDDLLGDVLGGLLN